MLRERAVSMCLIVIGLLAAGAPARSQPCGPVLEQGLYAPSSDDPLEDWERVRRWIVDTNAGTYELALEIAGAHGITSDIYQLELEGVVAQEAWLRWLSALGRADFSSTVPTPLFEAAARQASAALVATRDRCLEQPGVHLYTESTSDPREFRVKLQFRPTRSLPRLEITSFKASGEPGSTVTCRPELPNPVDEWWGLWTRYPDLPSDFESTCVRPSGEEDVWVQLDTDQTASKAWARARTEPTTLGLPPEQVWLGCTRDPTVLSEVEVLARSRCVRDAGAVYREEMPLVRWNRKVSTSVSCPQPDLGGDAEATMSLACASGRTGSLELEAQGRIRAHAGLKRAGCVGSPIGGRREKDCPAAAQLEGVARTGLWVDLQSHACLRVREHERVGRGVPRSRESRAFGVGRFRPSLLTLARPDGTAVSLEPGATIALDRPGVWAIALEAEATPAPDGLALEAPSLAEAGSVQFHDRLGFDVIPRGDDGSCSGALPADASDD